MGPEQLADAVLKVAKGHGATADVIVGDELLDRSYPTIHIVGRASWAGVRRRPNPCGAMLDGGIHPDLLEIVDGLPQPPLLTANERRLIKRIREFTENTDADIVVADGRDVLAFVMV